MLGQPMSEPSNRHRGSTPPERLRPTHKPRHSLARNRHGRHPFTRSRCGTLMTLWTPTVPTPETGVTDRQGQRTPATTHRLGHCERGHDAEALLSLPTTSMSGWDPMMTRSRSASTSNRHPSDVQPVVSGGVVAPTWTPSRGACSAVSSLLMMCPARNAAATVTIANAIGPSGDPGPPASVARMPTR